MIDLPKNIVLGRMEAIVAKLRERGCRITPQRVEIIKVFLSRFDHPGVEQVYEQVRGQFPTTSLATVYKTVHLLKEIGELLEISTLDGGNRYDGSKPYPHPHMVCIRCKAIVDPDLPLFRELAAQAESVSGYRITSHQLDFFGVCPMCQKK